MDVHCSTCGEPWDVYHLRHEAIFETGLSDEEAKAWQSLPAAERLSEQYREAFRGARWEFGGSVINVLHCPCCPAEAAADSENVAVKAAIEEILGDDEDGLAATFEEYGL